MKLAFDIGGVLGKNPDVFLPLIAVLQSGGAEVYVLTDISEKETAEGLLEKYGYSFPADKILCADFSKHGERCKAVLIKCKAVLIKEYGIDVLIDDHPGYCADSGCVSLFVWPDPHLPYEAP